MRIAKCQQNPRFSKCYCNIHKSVVYWMAIQTRGNSMANQRFDNLPNGTVVMCENGKRENMWRITGPLRSSRGRTYYGMQRWIESRKVWSGITYAISVRRIRRVVAGKRS
jgi:hypothetical protein